MRKFLWLLVFFFFILSGCSSHYYIRKSDSLKIYLKMPNAGMVYFASSLDGYELHPAMKHGRDTWIITVKAGAEFSYFYLVDGEVYLPDCRFRENDDFGCENCVYLPGM